MSSTTTAGNNQQQQQNDGLQSHLSVIAASTSSVSVSTNLNLPQHLLSAEPSNLYVNSLSHGGAVQDTRASRGASSAKNSSHMENLVLKCEPMGTPKHTDESNNLILPGDSHYLLHQPSPVTLIEYPLSCGSPLTSDDQMTHLMPGAYTSTAVTGSGGQMQLIRSNGPSSLTTGLPIMPGSRKRKPSQSNIGQPPPTVIKPEPDLNPSISRMIGLKQVMPDDMEPTNVSLDSTTGSTADSSDAGPMQSIKFSPFQPNQWHVLCSNNLQNL